MVNPFPSDLRWFRRLLLALTVALLPMLASTAFGEQQARSMQDVAIIGGVIGFQEGAVSGDQVLAIVYNPADFSPTREAEVVAGLVGSGFPVSDIILHSVLVARNSLPRVDHADAILATAFVDEQLLRHAVARLRVPCLTLHRAQIEHGTCMVALRSEPTVSIVLNQENADAAGVHFATAFRMMVQEL